MSKVDVCTLEFPCLLLLLYIFSFSFKQLLLAEINESQSGEVSISFTFRHHKPSDRVSTSDDESEVFAEVSYGSNQLKSSYYFQPQSNNNNAVMETPLASSTPIAPIDGTFPSEISSHASFTYG